MIKYIKEHWMQLPLVYITAALLASVENKRGWRL